MVIFSVYNFVLKRKGSETQGFLEMAEEEVAQSKIISISFALIISE